MLPTISILTLAVAGGSFLSYPSDDPVPGSDPQPAATQAIAGQHAWGDWNGDKLLDVYVIGPRSADRLFENLGNGTFQEITGSAGLDAALSSRIALWMDIDRDGDVDLFVAGDAGVRLFDNTGDSFEDVSQSSGLALSESTSSASWFDYDADGLPDLQLVSGGQAILFHNHGARQFRQVQLELPRASAGGVSPGLAAPGLIGDANPLGTASDPGQAVDENSSPRTVSDGTRRPITDISGEGSGGRSGGTSGPEASGGGGAMAGGSGSMMDPMVVGCVDSLMDQAGTACLMASSVPTPGLLTPAGADMWTFADDDNGMYFRQDSGDFAFQLFGWSRSPFGVMFNYGPHLTVNRTNGRVGIGTGAATPQSDLHLSGGTGSVELLIEADSDNDGENHQPRITMTQDGGSVVGTLGYLDASNDLTLANEFGGSNFVMRSNGEIDLLNLASQRTIEFDAHEAGHGALHLFRDSGVETVLIEANEADTGGNIELRTSANLLTLELDGEAGVGGGGFVRVSDELGANSIELRGSTGRLTARSVNITGGADIAEPFRIAGAELRPGMLVSIDPARVGELKVSDRAYDSAVAGVISGAGGISAGLVLTQEGSVADGEHPVALTGRVFCLADASAEPIRAGDLLTSSIRPGYAMKATDPERLMGAVIGKAMSALESGTGEILVLVNLQ